MLMAYAMFAAAPVSADQTVSLVCRATPVAKVVAELAATSGMSLEVAKQMSPDVLAIQAKDVPLEDLLARIAIVTTGEWRQDGETRRLYPAVGMRNREAADELSELTRGLRKTIGERLKGNGEEIPGGNPDQTIFTLLSRVDLSVVAALQPNERVVFSTQPTSMQRPLGNGAIATINAFVAEHNKGLSNTEAPPANDEIPEFFRAMSEKQNRPIGQVSKALLCVSNMALGVMNSVTLEVRLYDTSGKVAYNLNSMLPLDSSFIARATAIANQKTKDGKESKPIAVSEDSKAFAQALRSSNFLEENSGKVSEEFEKKILRPDLFDPLGYLATDIVFALAKDAGKPLVANLPDDAIDLLQMATVSEMSLDDAKAITGEQGKLKLVPDEQFLILKPVRPASARAERLSRPALAALMSAVVDHELPNLDELSAYAIQSPNPLNGGIGMSYLTAFVPGVLTQSMAGTTDWNALRLYGRLNPESRRQLQAGGALPFALLPPEAQSDLRRIFYGSMANLEVEGAGGTADPTGMMNILKQFGMGSGRDDYRTEPTEILPGGIPPQARLSAKVDSEPFVKPSGTRMMSGRGVMGLDELASLEMIRSNKDLAAIASQMTNSTTMRVGQRAIWKLNLQVAPAVGLRTQLMEHKISRDAKAMAYDSLPADVRKQIMDRAEALKKSPLGSLLNGLGGLGGTQTPPPLR